MIQHGDDAFAVHRRLAFDLPDGEITWEFMWLAENAIDEFRAERGLHERGLAARENNVTAGDLAGVYEAFSSARQDLKHSRDLMRAYQEVTFALERLGVYLAYGAAQVVTGRLTTADWARVPAMGWMIEVLEGLPSAAVIIPDQQLTDVAVRLAKRLRPVLQERGFDLYYTSDGTTYLDVL